MINRTVVGSFLCFTLLLVACGKSPEQALDEARALHAKGDRQGATLQLKSLLQDRPDSAAARLLLGQLNLEAGDFAGAEKELRRAQDGKVPAEQVLPLLAKALVMQGESKKVLAEIDPAKAVDPATVARLHAARGTAHLLLRQKDEAQAEFGKALSVKSGNPDALVGVSRILAGERKWSEALEAVDKALASENADPDAMMLRGDLLRTSGKSADAEEAYKKLIAAHPQHVTGLLAMVSLTVASNRLSDAEGYLASVRKASPGNPMGAYFQGLIAFRKNDYKAARDAIGAVLKVAPNHLPSVLLGGAIEFALGSQELAQTRLKYVLERAPRNVYARRVLAASYARAGQTQKALETLEPVINGGVKDPAMLALAGEVYMQLNDYEKAEAFFEKAAALDPKNARMRTGLGLSRLAGGDVDAATADLENAAQLDTSRHQADVLLVATHLQRKNFDQALKAAQALVAKQPDSPVGHNLIAAAYLGKQDEKSARMALMKALEVQPTYVPVATNLASLEIRRGDKKAARQLLEELIARDRKNFQAYMTLAALGPQLDATPDEIKKWLQVARNENPKSVQPLVMLARIYFQAKEPKKAMELVEKALVEAPDSTEILDFAGQVQLMAGEKNRALATFSRWAAAQPNSANALYRVATAQLAIEDRGGAIASLRKAIANRAEFSEAYGLLGETLARDGKYDDALRVAEDLKRLGGTSFAGWVMEGDIRMRQRRFPQAVTAYAKADGLRREAATVVKMHAALVLAGRGADGEARIKEWLREFPGDIGTRMYLGDAYLKQNNFIRAIGEYEKVLAGQSNNVIAMNNLAWCYLQTKDPRAVDTAENAYKLRPNDPAVMDTLGLVHVEVGDARKGLALLQKASSLAPKSVDIRFHLAQGYLKVGDSDAAREQIERVLLDAPQFPESEKALRILKELREAKKGK